MVMPSPIIAAGSLIGDSDDIFLLNDWEFPVLLRTRGPEVIVKTMVHALKKIAVQDCSRLRTNGAIGRIILIGYHSS